MVDLGAEYNLHFNINRGGTFLGWYVRTLIEGGGFTVDSVTIRDAITISGERQEVIDQSIEYIGILRTEEANFEGDPEELTRMSAATDLLRVQLAEAMV
jgi:hypothetical protein